MHEVYAALFVVYTVIAIGTACFMVENDVPGRQCLAIGVFWPIFLVINLIIGFIEAINNHVGS